MKKLSTRILFLIALIGFQYANATTFTVTNTLATGAGSLADAVNAANFDASATVVTPHIIDFSGLASGANTIVVTGQLQVRNAMIVDGATHPDGRVTVSAGGANHIILNFFDAGGLNPEGTIIKNLNIINSNANGIQMDAVSGITIQGCYVGINSFGGAISSNNNGIMLFNGSNNIKIGGTGIGEGNVISGNRSNGLLINGAGAEDNIVEGNLIGVDITGNALAANGSNGIHLGSGALNTIVGPGNVISGNNSNGVFLDAVGVNHIIGNLIGVGLDGTTQLGNGSNGIDIVNSSNIIIGGSSKVNRNVVSGNPSNGIRVFESSNCTVSGNFIGTDVTGKIGIPSFQGVNVTGAGSTGNTIGATTFMGRNVISGNEWHGVFFEQNASGNTVIGNYIGTDSTGLIPLGNGRNGVSGTTALNTTVGGTTEQERNIISGNGFNQLRPAGEGAYFSGVSFQLSDGLIVKGNYIGLGVDGETEIANANYGIWYIGDGTTRGANLIVGGILLGERNIISGNGSLALNPESDQSVSPYEKSSRGIYTFNVDDIRILNNYIGTNASGTSAKPNLADGLALISSTDIIIGGAGDSSNVISGNTYVGAHIFECTDVAVRNNFFGLNANGTGALANGQAGLYLHNQTNTVITENTLSGNSQTGLHISGGGTNSISSNQIGVASDGTTALGNVMGGIRISNSASNTLTENTVAYSTGASTDAQIGDGYGIYVGGTASVQNYIDQNSVYCNDELNISLSQDGTAFGTVGAGNNDKAIPTIYPSISTSTSTSGISNPGDEIQVFTNEPGCGCGGKTYLGSTTAAGDGTWTYVHGAVADSNLIAVTATSGNNTSQFACKVAISGDPTLTVSNTCEDESVDVTLTGHLAAILVWQFASDENFTTIILEDTTDAIADPYVYSYSPVLSGETWVRVISVVGVGNTATSNEVSFQVVANPTFTSLVASPDTICSGESSSVAINGATGTVSWFTSTDGTNFTSSSDPSTITPTQTTWYTAQLESATANCTTDIDTIQVTVNPLITGNVDLNLDANDVCAGTEQIFTATITDMGAGATIKWFIDGDEQIGESDSTFASSGLVDGEVVSVEVTYDTLCPARLTETDQITSSVDAAVVFNSLSAAPTEVCAGEGSTITLDANGVVTESWFISTDGTNFTSTSAPGTVTPSNTTWYTVILESANGYCSVQSDTVMITVNPLINGSVDLNLDANDVCAGTEQTFTATITDMGEGATIKWFVDGSEQLGESDARFASSGLNDGEVVSVEVTYDTLCPIRPTESDQETASIDAAVIFNSLSATPETICAGDESTISLDASGVVTESWFSSTDGTNFTATTAPGTISSSTSIWYAVTLESTNGFCSVQSDTVMITVNPIIKGDVDLTVDVNDVCDGTTQTFTANTTDVGSNATYLWTVDGTTHSETSNTFSSNTLANGDVVRVVVTLDTVCPAETQVFAQVVADINPILVPTVSISGDLAVCPGEAVNLTALVSNEGSNPSYAWTVDGNPAGTDSPTFSQALAFGAVVRVQLTSDALCANPTVVLSDQETVVDAGSVIAEISIEERQNDLCSPETLIIDANISGGGTTPAVRWFVNGVQVSTVITPFSYSAYNNGDTIHAELTSNATCIADPNASSDSVFVIAKDKLNSSVLVDLLFTSGQSGCTGDSLIVFLDTANLGTSPDFNWYINGDIQIENGDSLIRASVVNEDSVSYSVSVDPLECATDYYFEGFIEVERDTLIDPEVTIAGVFAGCILDSTKLIFIATHDNLDPISYQWYVDGEALVGETNSSISFTGAIEADSIAVTIQSEKGCLSSDSAYDSKILDYSSPVVAVAGADQIITEIQEVTLDGDGSSTGSDVNYVWVKVAGGDTAVVGSTIEILNEITTFENEFWLVVSNKYCVDTATTQVTIESDFHIPNVFSPNSDGTHDKWMITGIELYPDVQIEVYNRWGSLVFSTSKGDGYTIDNAWDGTNKNGEKLSDATYYYIVTLNNGSEAISKDVTIIR